MFDRLIAMGDAAQRSLTVPRPPRPYPSWTWDGSRWIAPVAYPEDGGLYQWDEAQQAWTEVVQ
jgi:hypothetical protein